MGTLAEAESADLVVRAANPVESIGNMEKVEAVFQHGVAYDPEKLMKSVRNLTGLR